MDQMNTDGRIRHQFGVTVVKRSHLIDMLMLTCGLESSHMISAARQYLHMMDQRAANKKNQLTDTA